VWLHTFSRSERWKEELLLVREEIRRVGSWYEYIIEKVELQAQKAIEDSEGSSHKNIFKSGFASLINKRILILKEEQHRLPLIAKKDLDIVNPDNIVLCTMR
jgi:hypothetical protein